MPEISAYRSSGWWDFDFRASLDLRVRPDPQNLKETSMKAPKHSIGSMCILENTQENKYKILKIVKCVSMWYFLSSTTIIAKWEIEQKES